MKTAIWILSFAIVGLLFLVYMQWRAIQKLTPASVRTTSPADDDDTATFGDMVKAVQKEAKKLEIVATF